MNLQPASVISSHFIETNLDKPPTARTQLLTAAFASAIAVLAFGSFFLGDALSVKEGTSVPVKEPEPTIISLEY